MAIMLLTAGLAPQREACAETAVQAVAINIPAQPAASALQRFIELTGFKLVYSPAVVQDVKANAVDGNYTPRQALDKMLEGTGLEVIDTGTGAATIQKKAERAADEIQAVIVTAQKRPSPEREVAGSVTALQGEQLEQRGAVGYEEYLREAPGVQYNKGESGYSTVSIRGLATSTGVATTQGTTGVYIEDVPFTDPYSVIALPDLGAFDLERVEVLHGPQGVLFGSASLGGAIRFVLNKPDLKHTDGDVQITGSHTSGGGANYGASGMANIAADDHTFGVRLVAYDRQDSGYIRNVTTSQDRVNETRQQGGRALATWKPVAGLTVTGIVMTEQSRISDSSAVSPDPDRYEIDVAVRQPRTLTTDFGNLQVNYELGDALLTSNTGYLKKKTEVTTDVGRSFDALFGNLATDLSSTSNNDASAFSQEFRVANREPGAFNWMGGLFFQRFREHYDGKFSGNGVTAAAETLYGGAFTLPLVGALTPDDSFYSQDIGSTAKETAAFGEVDWKFADRWSLTAGARAYKTQIDQDSDLSGLVSFLSFGAPTTTMSNSTSDHGVTPKLSLKYTTASGDMWYALASKGYRFGGLNMIPPKAGTSNPTSFKSDNLWNYETGVRLAFLDKKLFLDVTGFLMDWKNAQFTVLRSDNFAYVDNVGKARSTGAEIALRVRPISTLTLSAGASYIDAKTEVASAQAPSGARLPGTPHTQGFGDATYQFSGPFGSYGTASLSYSFVSKYFNDLQQTAQLGGYGVADLNLGFGFDKYEVTLFARNLANEKGKIGATAAPGLGYADYYLTKPRSIGVSLRADF